jgi:hypothetical protein
MCRTSVTAADSLHNRATVKNAIDNASETQLAGDAPAESPLDGWEQARISHLLHFASLTPAHRIEWLAWAFEFWTLVQESRQTAAEARRPND